MGYWFGADGVVGTAGVTERGYVMAGDDGPAEPMHIRGWELHGFHTRGWVLCCKDRKATFAEREMAGRIWVEINSVWQFIVYTQNRSQSV